MRTAPGALLALMAFVVSALSQQKPAVAIDPEKPTIGKKISLTYDSSSPRAVLKDPKTMLAEIMILGDGDPVVVESTLENSGKLWKGTFTVADKGAQILLCQFRSGELVDNNGEDTWSALIYGDDGRPVKGAYIARATIRQYANLQGFKTQKNPEAASADLDEELKIYPDNWRAEIARWGFMGRQATSDEGKAKIRKELPLLYAAHQDDEEAVVQMLVWYDRIGEKQKADSIRSLMIAAHPTGKVAEATQQDKIYQERDPAKRVKLIQDFLNAFPQKGSTLENLQMQLFVFSMRASDYAKAESVLQTMEQPSGQMYNSLAWPFIEKGENLEQAVGWAKKGLGLLDPNDLSLKPRTMTTWDWKQNTKYGRGMVLDTYGYGLMKLGRMTEAQAAFEEAVTLTDYGDPEINERAASCLMEGKHYQKVIDIALTCILKGKANDNLMEYHKKAYVALHGSDAGYQESVVKAKKAATDALLETLAKERISKPAIPFALKSLDGSTVRLADLRGKIVVIDFWATWCGPCIQSFPYLQKVYEKHKNDGDIVILAVNTWESKSGQELVDQVRDFVNKNKYSFPVLFDEGFVEKYGVEGIPTKFIIDQKGTIQFKDIGFGGGDEMMQKMELQFQLLRKGTE
jgi:thiol-disulfide isomerase/thioredoxin